MTKFDITSNMRIVLTGQAAFGETVLNKLIENQENVVGVFCPPDQEGRPGDALKIAAQNHNIPVYQFRRLRDTEAIDAFKSLRPNLGVMAFVTDIVPEEILTAPTEGTIQYHPSLLPKHRGPSSINWPIIQGETQTGLSIFWPDAGLDTGPVLLQKQVPIEPDDTLGSVYFGKLFPLGVEAMVEAVGMVRAGTAPKLPQDDSEVTYESWCTADNVAIAWDKPVDTVYNLMRGSDPSPGANSTYKGTRIKFFGVSKTNGDDSRLPGEVAAITDEGIEVSVPGGKIKISRVQPDGSKKCSAAEWANAVELNIGDRFGEIA